MGGRGPSTGAPEGVRSKDELVSASTLIWGADVTGDDLIRCATTPVPQ